MKIILIACFLVVLLVLLYGCSRVKTAAVSPRLSPGSLDKAVCRNVRINYLLYLPKDYGKTDKKWPLMLFLHGAGERGSDLNLVKKHGLAKLAAEGKDFDFIIVCPQCPENDWWPKLTDDLIVLVDDIAERYNVDTKRLYVTGLSMGGFGTWNLIQKYPDKFAAAAPVCGGGDSIAVTSQLKDMPIWVFHGAKDNVVPPGKSEEMVKALKAAGNSNVKFTLYPDAGHDSWTATYNNPELYAWFLSCEKK
jgi:predicted peptidase